MESEEIIYVIYPALFKAVSMNSLAMLELLLDRFVASSDVKFNLLKNVSLQLDNSADVGSNKIIDIMLMPGRLDGINIHIQALHSEDYECGQPLGALKFLVSTNKITLDKKDEENDDSLSKKILEIIGSGGANSR